MIACVVYDGNATDYNELLVTAIKPTTKKMAKRGKGPQNFKF